MRQGGIFLINLVCMTILVVAQYWWMIYWSILCAALYKLKEMDSPQNIDDSDHQVYHSTQDDAGNNQQIVISTEHRTNAEEVMNR